LDAALKRAGRFDKKIPILLPEKEERANILEIIIKKYKFETDIAEFTPFAEQMENYTGAEIESVVRKAYEIANEDEREGTAITADVLNEAIIRCRPSTQQVEYMTMLAVKECDDKDYFRKNIRICWTTKKIWKKALNFFTHLNNGFTTWSICYKLYLY
jgi:SpoVK/Ycf46/Vps4 family AAA+-type ATPase